MAGAAIRNLALVGLAATALAGCQPGQGLSPRPGAPETDGGARAATSVRLVDRDVEAPEVFQVTDQALWDGRPSLGGVWVASPDAVDPERVIMRNPANGKFVIGALFRREVENPGPKLQISSDAAAALGVLAGQPVKVSVTALRREEAPVTAPDATKPILDAAETVEVAALDGAAPPAKPGAKPAAGPQATAPGAIEATALDAIGRAEGGSGPAAAPAQATRPAAQPAAPAPKPAAPAAAPAPAQGGALIQIGIFSVEANARRAADMLAKAGLKADIRAETSQGKSFWSVTTRGDASALAKVKSAGFADAYILKR